MLVLPDFNNDDGVQQNSVNPLTIKALWQKKKKTFCKFNIGIKTIKIKIHYNT